MILIWLSLIINVYTWYVCCPDEDDTESIRVWYVEVAKAYWRAADRNIDCEELDPMCNDDNDKWLLPSSWILIIWNI